MKDLSHYQQRVLDRLLPNLDRPEPYQELYRAGMLYRVVNEKAPPKWKGLTNFDVYDII